MTQLLSVRDLSVSYGKVEAVHGVSLDVNAGQIVTVIGPNGAGKTTLLAAIMGLLPARGGVTYVGATINARSVEARVATGLVLVPEKRELFGSMTVAENLELGAFARSSGRDAAATLIDVYRRFPRLDERRGQRAGTLSGGERQMLALGRAMMSEPHLICLDEPSLGLAPLVVQDIFRTIKAINAAGTSVLLVEQNARYALETASRGYVLQTGSIVASGNCARLRNDDRVRQAYLGRSAAERVKL